MRTLKWLFSFCILFALTQPPATAQVVAATSADQAFFMTTGLEELMNMRLPVPRDTTFMSMSLEELMDIPISVASKTALTVRESPAVVSVITREEIQNMGARDVMDVLNQIPGFSFGVDVQNVIGVGTRGNWGHEGKILVLLDGQEMNEILYSTMQFGQHFDIMSIEKIEIIRGPGSSIYGGYAELGVINIITRNGKDLSGVNVSATTGFTANANPLAQTSVSIGNEKNDIQYSLSGFYGSGKRSDQAFTDAEGTTINLKNNSGIHSGMINGGISYKGWNARMIYDRYSVETVDQFDVIYTPKDQISFQQLYSEVKYQAKAGRKITITPSLKFKRGTPWRTTLSQDESLSYFNVTASRFSPNVMVNFDDDKLNLVAGVDSYFDHAKYTGVNPTGDHYGASDAVSYSNVGVFVQGLISTRIVNFIVGSRLDNHSQFGANFSPRLGITKIFNDFHFKLLYNRSFRAPAVDYFIFNPGIKPERTTVFEVELGYKLNDHLALTGNVFDIRLKNPIVYYVNDEFPIGAYQNFQEGGSQGFELELKARYAWGYLSTNYAYYTSKKRNGIDLYNVPANDKMVLAFPDHRVNLNASLRAGKHLTIDPSLNLIGPRWTKISYDDYQKCNTQLFFNLFLNYHNLLKGMTVGAGAYDLGDQKQTFIQPYGGGHNPMPGIGRQFILRLSYTLDFEKR